ncbi:Uncharacterized protein PECH_001309 [Penicillium ucsense]|uniref:Uncharacterized protein n=1 Tax=Penicillium ucsense TaxID=2839758 RepID=A0A8J8VZR2_9EURO|nr:Uncharacterized protein PECM_001056 [Penicillium ucsense]KAF7732999.1 Uncharacterized protein PECH_001309 [Penicillium ucsense]
MASPAICSPRSARLLLAGTVNLPTLEMEKAKKAISKVEKKTFYFPGLKPLAVPWRLAPWRRSQVGGSLENVLASGARQTLLAAPQLRADESPRASHLGLKTESSAQPVTPVLRPALRPARLPPRSILKRVGGPVKRHDRHVSFGDVAVQEIARPDVHVRVFPPPRWAYFPTTRPTHPELPSPSLEVEDVMHEPRWRHVESFVKPPSVKELIVGTACCAAFMGILWWLG